MKTTTIILMTVSLSYYLMSEVFITILYLNFLPGIVMILKVVRIMQHSCLPLTM